MTTGEYYQNPTEEDETIERTHPEETQETELTEKDSSISNEEVKTREPKKCKRPRKIDSSFFESCGETEDEEEREEERNPQREVRKNQMLRRKVKQIKTTRWRSTERGSLIYRKESE